MLWGQASKNRKRAKSRLLIAIISHKCPFYARSVDRLKIYRQKPSLVWSSSITLYFRSSSKSAKGTERQCCRVWTTFATVWKTGSLASITKSCFSSGRSHGPKPSHFVDSEDSGLIESLNARSRHFRSKPWRLAVLTDFTTIPKLIVLSTSSIWSAEDVSERLGCMSTDSNLKLTHNRFSQSALETQFSLASQWLT